jgi:small subunit ribosomal protein S2
MPSKKKTEKESKEKEEKDKKEELLAKAKELEGKITEKEKKKEEKELGTLIPIDDYVKAGCYIGTKVITPDMRKYVYRRRADGIAIINTNLIDEKIKEAAKFLAGYSIQDFIVVCKREAGWKAVKLFSELTGVRVFTKKYPAGIITNTNLPDFFETELIFICDPWLDKNALNDALNVRKKVMAVCDTNNLTKGADVVIPANNKSNKSLGVIFYILAREYMKAKGIEKKLPEMEEFIGEKLLELEPKKSKSKEEEKKRDIEKIESIMKLDKEK